MRWTSVGFVVLAACAGEDRDPGVDPADVVTLAVDPASVILQVHEGEPVRQAFTVRAQLADGREIDVTGKSQLSIDADFAQVEGAEIVTSGRTASVTTLRVSLDHAPVQALVPVTILVERTRVLPGTPGGSADLLVPVD
jgi:hypothetical protein